MIDEPLSPPPLEGYRVVDLSHVLAGPFATYQMGLLGAGIIRVERVDGDDFVRNHGGTDEMRAAGLGASFLSQNMHKKSIALDLKSEKGREVYFRLASTADAVTENFRPGVVDRLGVGFEATRMVNPGIVYCSLSGFGPDGPLADKPAYDHILQGISGMMAMTGTDESGPMRVGFPIVDYVAGQALAAAMLAAFVNRLRGHEGAQHVQLSMLDALVGLMGPYMVNLETTGTLRGLEGNGAFSGSPFSGRFDTADGQIVVTANSPSQTERMCTVLGRDELARCRSPERIADALEATLMQDTAENWERLLSGAGVPSAKVRTLAEILEHPQMAFSPLMQDLPVPELGTGVRVPGLPFRQNGWRQPAAASAPTLGRDTDEVLSALGYSGAEIAQMRDDRIVG